MAQTIDRFLSLTLGCQRYGTNVFNNLETGAEELVPNDRRVTDAERARFAVPPLADTLSRYKERPKPTESADTLQSVGGC